MMQPGTDAGSCLSAHDPARKERDVQLIPWTALRSVLQRLSGLESEDAGHEQNRTNVS